MKETFMCREFVLKHEWSEVAWHFKALHGLTFAPSFKWSSGDSIPTIHSGDDVSTRIGRALRWGLVPNWADSDQAERRLFNARAETLHEKRAFRDLLRSRRCIVPASGFYEWTTQRNDAGESERVPLYVHQKDEAVLGFAALWDEWITPFGNLRRSCTIITTESNRLLASHHARMPAILNPKDYAAWLDPKLENADALRTVLQPFDARQTVLRPLSRDNMKLDSRDERRIEAVGEMVVDTSTHHEPKKRVVQRDWTSPDGQVFFKTRSFTRDDYTTWHPVIDLQTGHVWCDCPDFRFRHAMHEPSTGTPNHWCKHVARALENCKRHGELAAA
jgi:putative SOS response-associated peptidase YedK